jgi:hypothetical protein
MESKPMYWPDKEDQEICMRFLMHGGSEGYAMCYLYGYYHHAGETRDAAVERVCQAMVTRQEG